MLLSADHVFWCRQKREACTHTQTHTHTDTRRHRHRHKHTHKHTRAHTQLKGPLLARKSKTIQTHENASQRGSRFLVPTKTWSVCWEVRERMYERARVCVRQHNDVDDLTKWWCTHTMMLIILQKPWPPLTWLSILLLGAIGELLGAQGFEAVARRVLKWCYEKPVTWPYIFLLGAMGVTLGAHGF